MDVPEYFNNYVSLTDQLLALIWGARKGFGSSKSKVRTFDGSDQAVTKWIGFSNRFD